MLHDRQNAWRALDLLRRKLALKQNLKRQLLRSVVRNTNIPFVQRYNASRKLSMIPQHSSTTRIRNRCVISGRNYNVIRKTQYSRFVFRRNAYFSGLPGVRRSSW